jgi:hypothetical protein
MEVCVKAAAKETPVKVRMRRLNVRQEALAQALAHGASPNEAHAEAGYAESTDEANRHANHPAIVARVQELTAQLQWGGSEDLAPVIDALSRLFDESQELKSAAAIKERREILVQVARLKALLPHRPPAHVFFHQLSDEAWVEKHVPKNL